MITSLVYCYLISLININKKKIEKKHFKKNSACIVFINWNVQQNVVQKKIRTEYIGTNELYFEFINCTLKDLYL